MFLPIGDTPNPKITPWLTWLLMAANISVFLGISVPLMTSAADPSSPLFPEFLRVMQEQTSRSAAELGRQVSAYDLFIFRYGYRPSDPSLLTLFTAMFLHASWLHLGGNMLFLYIFGDNVERRLGRFGYFFAYLGTGIVATLFFALFAGDSPVPMLGASGAISGVLGCYFIWFPRNRVKVFIFLFPFIMDTVQVPARVVLGLYLVVDNLLPFLVRLDAASGVAHGAHIGGFLAGLAVALLFRRRQGGER